MLTPEAGDLDLAARAAWLYYGDGLTQAQVATRLFVSRQTVGRLLETARQTGIVRIELDASYLAALDLATRLKARTPLQDVVVVPSLNAPLTRVRMNERVAAAVAAYVRRFLRPGAIVGVGWADTVARALTMLSGESLEGVVLASAAGTITNVAELVAENPAAVRCLRTVPSPLFVSSPELAASLRKEDAVVKVFDLARSATLTLTGVGAARPGGSAVRTGMVTDEDVAAYREAGAVGDMLGHWFGARGQEIPGAASDRAVSLSLAELRSLPNVIGVAAGEDKVEAIRGAIAGGYLKILVTDEPTAQALLGLG